MYPSPYSMYQVPHFEHAEPQQTHEEMLIETVINQKVPLTIDSFVSIGFENISNGSPEKVIKLKGDIQLIVNPQLRENTYHLRNVFKDKYIIIRIVPDKSEDSYDGCTMH